MPSAKSATCVQCKEQAGKYKCSKCGEQGVTCSLACSKKHSALHTAAAQDDLGNAGARSLASHPPLTANGSKGDDSTGNFNARLSKGDHKALLQDYLFLSSMTRRVSDIGRTLSSESWSAPAIKDSRLQTHAGPAAAAELALQMQEREERENSRRGKPFNGRGKGKGKANAAEEGPLSRDAERRQLLAKQARYLRVPLFPLPEGMNMARENRSRWLRREGRLDYTVELRCPPCRSKLAGSRICLLHNQPPDVNPVALLLDHIEGLKEDGTSSKKSNGRKRGRGKGKQEAGPSNGASSTVEDLQERQWRVSDASLKNFLKSLLDPSNEDSPQGDGKVSFDDRMEGLLSQFPLDQSSSLAASPVYRSLGISTVSRALTLCVPLVRSALRNESSQKHLDWYQRQLQKGAMAGYTPFETVQQDDAQHADGLQPPRLLPDGAAPETRWPANAPTGPKAMREPSHSEDARVEPPPQQLLPPEGTSVVQEREGQLLKFGLLAKLSAQMKSVAPPAKEEPAIKVESAPEPEALALEKTVKPAEAPTDDQSELKQKAPRAARRALLPLPAHLAATLSLEKLLQSIPPGFAIVEYPLLEVWRPEHLERSSRNGEVLLQELYQDPAEREMDSSDDSSSSSDTDSDTDTSSSSDVNEVMINEKDSTGATARAVKVPKVLAQGAPTSNGTKKEALIDSMAGYGSATSESAGEEASGIAKPPNTSRSAQTNSMRQMQDDVKPVKTWGLGSMLAYADSDSDEENNSGEEAEPVGVSGGGLASFARMVGMAPAQLHDNTSHTQPAVLRSDHDQSTGVEELATVSVQLPDYRQEEDVIDYGD